MANHWWDAGSRVKRTAGVGCRRLVQEGIGDQRFIHVEQGDPRGLDPPD